MSDLNNPISPLPPPRPGIGWFEPTPRQLTEQLAATCEQFGEKSIEYVWLLVQLGDAHMVQGLLSNPDAQASYEKALEILQTSAEATPEIAWLYDKLAIVKQSSGDSFGAQADLEKAISFWKGNSPANAFAPDFGPSYVARREEDLENLVRLNIFLKRKPPEL